MELRNEKSGARPLFPWLPGAQLALAEANMAQRTGLEPATPGVTGRYSNRLNYRCASVQPLTLRLARKQNSQEVVGDDGIEPPTLCL